MAGFQVSTHGRFWVSTEVLGVPPSGEWKPDDHRDAALSSYYDRLANPDAESLGIAIQIEHRQDDGSLWVRVPLTMRRTQQGFDVTIQDGATVPLPEDYSSGDLERLFAAIHSDLIAFFDVRRPGQARIGFDVLPGS